MTIQEDDVLYSDEDSLKKAAEDGDSSAKGMLAMLVELNIVDSDGKGIGKREDMTPAKKLYEELSGEGDALSELALGRILPGEDDLASSEKYFTQAMEKGFRRYQKIVGNSKKNTSVSSHLPKILVVDDSEAERDVIATVVRTYEFEALEASHGGEALQILRETDGVVLVITDVSMPILDGIGLSKKIRTMPKYKSLPIVISSGIADKKVIVEAKSLGIGGWLVKPVKIDKVRLLLDRMSAAMKKSA